MIGNSNGLDLRSGSARWASVKFAAYLALAFYMRLQKTAVVTALDWIQCNRYRSIDLKRNKLVPGYTDLSRVAYAFFFIWNVAASSLVPPSQAGAAAAPYQAGSRYLFEHPSMLTGVTSRCA